MGPVRCVALAAALAAAAGVAELESPLTMAASPAAKGHVPAAAMRSCCPLLSAGLLAVCVIPTPTAPAAGAGPASWLLFAS